MLGGNKFYWKKKANWAVSMRGDKNIVEGGVLGSNFIKHGQGKHQREGEQWLPHDKQ